MKSCVARLDGILDIERLLSRITLETANPRDMLALAASLAKLPAVRTRARAVPCRAFRGPHAISSTNSTDVRERIERSIVAEPPITLNDGGVIRSGVDAQLDELRDISRNSKQLHCPDRAARARAHGHQFAEGQVQQCLRLLHRDQQVQLAARARRL